VKIIKNPLFWGGTKNQVSSEHILEAIKRIEGYCADIDELGFISSQLIQDADIQNF
jgi:uncharacterized protein with HEPN domain